VIKNLSKLDHPDSYQDCSSANRETLTFKPTIAPMKKAVLILIDYLRHGFKRNPSSAHQESTHGTVRLAPVPVYKR